eukprot:298342_1
MSQNVTTTHLTIVTAISTTNYVTTLYKDEEDDLLSTGMFISIVYGFSHLLLLLILAIHIYLNSRKESQKLSIKHFILDLWKERGIYTPLLIHIYDTATDVGVLYEWYKLAQIEKKGTNLKSLDMNQFFWCGMGFMFAYRGLLALGGFGAAAYNIYDKDVLSRAGYKFGNDDRYGWLPRTILSFLAGLVGAVIGALELMVFVGIFIDFHKKQNGSEEKKGAGKYQKACQSTEGVLESLPEVIMQSVFVMRAINDETLDKAAGAIFILVIFSIFASLLSITSKYVWVDEYMVYQYAASITLSDDDIEDLEEDEKHFIRKCKCYPKYYVSLGYIIRVVWRLAAVISRFVIFALIWVALGGAFEIILVPMMVLVWYISIFCYAFRGKYNATKVAIKKLWESIGGFSEFGVLWCGDSFISILICLALVAAVVGVCIIGVVFQLGIAVLSGKVIYIIRMIENFILMAAISIFAFVKFECEYCASYEYRDAIKNYRILLWITIGWVSVLIHMIMSFLMVKIIDKEYKVDVGTIVEKVFEDYQRTYHKLLYNQIKKQMLKDTDMPKPTCIKCNVAMTFLSADRGDCRLGDHKGYEWVWHCQNDDVDYCMPCSMKWIKRVNEEKDDVKRKDLKGQTQNEIELTTK